MSTELSVVKPEEFAIVQADQIDTGKLLAENMGGRAITPFNIDRIQVPAGGGIAWVVPMIDGDASEKFLDVIVLHFRFVRRYYATEFSGGNNPPDCYSEDTEIGIGKPGGACHSCAFAKFGSAKKGGRGQACEERSLLFVLRQGDRVPCIVSLPPTSLTPWEKFRLRVTSKMGIPIWQVVIRLGLVPKKNADGIMYSMVTFARAVPDGLTGRALDAVSKYRAAILPALSRVRANTEDFQTAESRPSEFV